MHRSQQVTARYASSITATEYLTKSVHLQSKSNSANSTARRSDTATSYETTPHNISSKLARTDRKRKEQSNVDEMFNFDS